MRLWTVLFDVLWLALVIPVVLVLFRVIPDRKAAASVAGVLFFLVPALLMKKRWSRPLPSMLGKALWWVGVLQFWILFAVPMLAARLIYWQTSFEEFSFFGFSGPRWHELSSKSYAAMILLILLAGISGRTAAGKRK